MKNYYQILGLEEGATLDEIKAAYKKYAAKFHPDKHGDDEFFKERFQEIQEAYEYLLNHYEDNRAESENKYILTIDNIVLFECNPQQVQVGDTIIIKWQINHECKCVLEIDNVFSTWTDDTIPIQGEKQIKVNRINGKIKVAIKIYNNYSGAGKTVTIYEKDKALIEENLSTKSDVTTRKENSSKWIYALALTLTLAFIISYSQYIYYTNKDDNSNKIREAIIKLEKCQYYNDYITFIEEYNRSNDIAIKQLVDDAYTKKEERKIEAFDIKYFRHKNTFYDASKILSLTLHIDNEQQQIYIFDKSKNRKVTSIEYVYTETSSDNKYNYYYYGQELNKIVISKKAIYSYNGLAYYRIELGEKIYL